MGPEGAHIIRVSIGKLRKNGVKERVLPGKNFSLTGHLPENSPDLFASVCLKVCQAITVQGRRLAEADKV